MDGTEWKIGSFKVHVLVLAAQVKGVAIPVYFKVYEHKGVLSEHNRIIFIRKAFSIIDLHGKLLIADREFIGKNWLSSLTDLGLHFVIRLRKGMYRSQIQNMGVSYDELERKTLKKGYAKVIFQLDGRFYKLELWRSTNNTEPIVYLITNVLDKQRIGKKYAKRWKIEYCFKHLKTNGFNLEDMSMTDLKKIRLMISLVIVAYILAVREGLFQRKKQKIRTIKYRNGDRYPAVSTFKNGLQAITNLIVSWLDLDKYIALVKKKKYSILKIV